MTKAQVKFAVLGAVAGLLTAAVYMYVTGAKKVKDTSNPTTTAGTDVKQPVF